ncbi:unnamed protein product [Vitrella brassicaformis CCMP3155]|uniref:Uncharacterized protein n=1 Tax=Vitrella brassicaformis (strain CCMP3155) TaxID=1169540 RepID=A0A0G4FX74_VITBC|nr:unnamed protein product [Vitrella brassicaformis CCMP3155]|eukprot:CEM19584.1 unnamed protein product [Vitrella brassicaformis CCMP3155]
MIFVGAFGASLSADMRLAKRPAKGQTEPIIDHLHEIGPLDPTYGLAQRPRLTYPFPVEEQHRQPPPPTQPPARQICNYTFRVIRPNRYEEEAPAGVFDDYDAFSTRVAPSPPMDEGDEASEEEEEEESEEEEGIIEEPAEDMYVDLEMEACEEFFLSLGCK